MRTLIESGYLKGTSGAGRALLKYQRNVFSFKLLLLGTGIFCLFKFKGKIQQKPDLLRGEIKQLRKLRLRRL